jgi:hypothetical protein
MPAAFAFNGIQTVTVPDSVTTVKADAFAFQSSLMNAGGTELDSGDNARITAYLNQIWYTRLYTADPSNPNTLTSSDGDEALAFDGDVNGDGDVTDSIGGYLVNPAKITLSYQDHAGANVRAADTLTGTDLTNYLAGANTTNDLSTYYTLDSSPTFTPPAIAPYVTPEAATVTLASPNTTYTFVYRGAAPTLVSLSPATNAQDVLLNPTLRATFDQPVQLCEGECAISLVRADNDSTVTSWWPGAAGFSGNNTTTLTLTLPAGISLDPSTTYYLVAGGVSSTDDNAPFIGLDADTDWRFTTGDGDIIAAAVENAAPNSGDGNDDGTLDSLQPYVTSFVSPITNKYVTIAVPSTCALIRSHVVAESSNSAQDSAYSYPLGLADFSAQCGTPGFSAAVKVYFHGAQSSSAYVARKFIGGAYVALAGAQLSPVAIGDTQAVVLSYTATDGDTATDSDGMANGTIVDPAGLGLPQSQPATSTTATATRAASGGGLLANTGQAFLAILMFAAVLIGLSTLTRTARTKKLS